MQTVTAQTDYNPQYQMLLVTQTDSPKAYECPPRRFLSPVLTSFAAVAPVT